MNDKLLENLGTYFVYHQLREKYGWTFEEFVNKWERDLFIQY